MKRWIRIVLVLLSGAIGLTALAGGAALVAGSVGSLGGGAIVPDRAFLDASPFASYIVPGLILALVVGGSQLTASLMVGRGSAAGPFAAAVAAFALLIWIFVQMMVIPFSVLQALYFAAGLAELGFLLLGLGVLRRTPLVRRA